MRWATPCTTRAAEDPALDAITAFGALTVNSSRRCASMARYIVATTSQDLQQLVRQQRFQFQASQRWLLSPSEPVRLMHAHQATCASARAQEPNVLFGWARRRVFQVLHGRLLGIPGSVVASVEIQRLAAFNSYASTHTRTRRHTFGPIAMPIERWCTSR